jgi:hypothetical protein
MSLEYFDEVREFTDVDALKTLFYRHFKIKQIKFEKKVAFEIYSLNDCFIKTLLMPLNPTAEDLQWLIAEIKNLATNQP